MKFRVVCKVLLISLLANSLMAQKAAKISGVIMDEEKNPLIAATVVLLNLSDSTFASYVLTNDFGKFQLDGKRDSTYLLQVSYLGYASYRQNIHLRQDTLLPTVELKTATNTLESVEVTAEHIPVQMRGDTLSFNSAAFHIRTHDNVESLLKQLPGVEIDAKGKVTVNGKAVTEILVDGKEFFGENAQIVLKNLPADVIKNIDITETKKNKEGEEVIDQKTINLKLKEDSKKGLMGYLNAGYGYTIPPRIGNHFSTKLGNHRYLGGIMLSYFSPKFQVSISGATNNVNAPLFISRAGSDPTEVSAPKSGITRALTGGISIYAILSEKSKLSIGYNYFNNTRETNEESSLRSVLPGNIYSRIGQTLGISTPNRHVISMSLRQKIDSTQRLNFYCNVNYELNDSKTDKENTTRGEIGQLENKIKQIYKNVGERFTLTPRLNYQKDFKKPRRNFRVNFRGSFAWNPKEIGNNTFTDLYNNNGVLTEIDTLRQKQDRTNNRQSANIDLTFNEPIGKGNSLSFKLLFGIRDGQNTQSIYDLGQGQIIRNDSLSNSYWRHNDYQEANIRFKRRTKKYMLQATLGVKRSALEGIVGSDSSKVNQAFYFPTGFFRAQYYINKGNKITFSYRSRFSEPRIEQLQPIINNQNPFYIVMGNPNLLPEYNHDLGLGTNLWNKTTFTNFYVSMNFSIIQNTIIRSQTLDENFRSIEQPVNRDLSYRGGIYLGYNTTIKKIGVKVNIKGGGNFHRRPIILNEVLTNQFNQNYNASLNISNKKKDIVDFLFVAEMAVGHSIYENNSDLNVTYVNHSYGANLRVTIAKKWNLETKFKYFVYGNTSYGSSIFFPIWSAGINRTFLKNDALMISLVGENLLNEALQVNRSNKDGIVSEHEAVLLGRYVMLKIAYRIKNIKF